MLTEFKDLGSKSLSMVNQSVPTAEWVSWTFTNCSSYGFIDFTETNETAASIKFLDPTSGATLATASLTSGTPVANPGYSTIKVKITNTQGVLATFNGEIRIYDLSDTEAAGSNTQVMFNDSGSLAGDSGLTFNKTSNSLTVLGTLNAGISDPMTVNGVSVNANLQANSDTIASIESHTHSPTAGVGSYFYGARSRGTTASPTVVQNGDVIGGMYFVGYDGTDYATSSALVATVNGTPGSNDMPGKLSIQTSADGSQTLTERLGIDSSGLVTVSSLTASQPVGTDASKGLVSLSSISSSYITGITTGSNPGAGLIGELIESTKTTDTSGSASVGTMTDVGHGTFTLTAGVWEVEASIIMSTSGIVGAGVVGTINRLQITDASNVVQREIFSGFGNTSYPEVICQLYVKTRIAISGSTVYKARFGTLANSGSPTITSCTTYASSTYPSYIRATRVG